MTAEAALEARSNKLLRIIPLADQQGGRLRVLIVGARERARKKILRGSREEERTEEEGERQGGGGRNGARGTREVRREV